MLDEFIKNKKKKIDKESWAREQKSDKTVKEEKIQRNGKKIKFCKSCQMMLQTRSGMRWLWLRFFNRFHSVVDTGTAQFTNDNEMFIQFKVLMFDKLAIYLCVFCLHVLFVFCFVSFRFVSFCCFLSLFQFLWTATTKSISNGLFYNIGQYIFCAVV